MQGLDLSHEPFTYHFVIQNRCLMGLRKKPLYFPYYASALELNLISHRAWGQFPAPPTVPDARTKTKSEDRPSFQRHTLLFMTRTPD